MNHFSPDTTFRSLFAEPCFAGWQHMLDYRRNGVAPWVDDATMGQFQEQTGWNLTLMLEGLEHVYACCSRRQVFYPIYDTTEDDKDLTGLAAFPLEKKSKFVVIVPGGGYGAVCSLLDGYSYAKELNAMGYAAFVVCYRVTPHTQPTPQADLARAVRFILDHAEQFNLDTRDYGVMGFSAGGHLAASFGVQDLGYGAYDLPKPGTMFICYPVIIMGTGSHTNSEENFLGPAGSRDEALTRRWSLEKRVTADYPPTFLWQCVGDPAVSIRNSACFAEALDAQGVPHIYETFPYASHGLPADAPLNDKQWLNRAVAFWKRNWR